MRASRVESGRLRQFFVAVLSAALLVTSLACGDDDNGGGTPALGSASIECSLAVGTIAARSQAQVPVTATVTRDGVAVGGAQVLFVASRGLVTPFNAVTALDGRATAFFQAPDTAGTVLIDTTVLDQGVETTATCPISVTASANDPLVQVTTRLPEQLAGLTVTLGYDGSLVGLLKGSAAVGALAADGASCFSDVRPDDVEDEVVLTVACTSNVRVRELVVAEFPFENLAGVQILTDDFTVACTGVDEDGDTISTFCTLNILQL